MLCLIDFLVELMRAIEIICYYICYILRVICKKDVIFATL